MAITVDPTDNQYDLAEVRLDQETIISNECNLDLGEDGGDPKYATNSEDPYRRSGKKNTVEWGLSDIAPEYYDLLLEYKMSGKTFPIQYYTFGKGGKYNHRVTAVHARVKELNWSYSDDGPTIECSGDALGVEKPR